MDDCVQKVGGYFKQYYISEQRIQQPKNYRYRTLIWPPRVRYCITLMLARIPLFNSMRIRIRIFSLMPIRILLLIKVTPVQFSDHWSTDPPWLFWASMPPLQLSTILHGSILILHCSWILTLIQTASYFSLWCESGSGFPKWCGSGSATLITDNK